MKKVLTALIICFFGLGFTLQAGERERAITFGKLPMKAQNFITDNFSKDQVLLITEETEFLDKEFKVMLENGISLKFESDGAWKKVENKLTAVPESLIPSEIRSFVDQKFPKADIREIQRKKRGWEIELMNGISLEFDKRFNLVDYDD
jgi:hypothetical protein